VVADLQRLTEAVAELRTVTESYEKEVGACFAAIIARSLPEARQRLVTIDGLREELGERLEAIRAGMFATLKVISTRIRRMTRQFDVVLRRIIYNNQYVNLKRMRPSWRTRRVNRSMALSGSISTAG
jgi:DNA-binding TFAR19-related protein (PDSD5 family)